MATSYAEQWRDWAKSSISNRTPEQAQAEALIAISLQLELIIDALRERANNG